jgi:DNA-binding transcriptional LysR family regulator
MDFHLEQMKVFYYAAKYLSITKAAEKLYISQPAASKAIKVLEEKLGVTLFLRTPKGLHLTEQGEKLNDYVCQAFHFLEAGVKKLDGLQQQGEGQLRIGAGDTLCKYLLLPLLEKFRLSHPKIKLKVCNKSRPEILKLMKQGELDYCIFNLPVQEEGLEITVLTVVEDCFVVGDAYRHLLGKVMKLQDLTAYPLILPYQETFVRKLLDAFFLSKGVALKPEIELGSIELLAEFARIGAGISCIPKEFVSGKLQSGVLHKLEIEEKIPERQIGIVRYKVYPPTEPAQHFAELLREISPIRL